MELDELKKIWNSQEHEEMYTINTQAMNDHIQRKKQSALHLVNISELLSIIVHFGAGAFTILLNRREPPSEIFLYILGAWMLGAGLYSLVFRIKRTMGAKRFDRSVRGDLDYTVSTAHYQVRLSQILRWNVVPIALLTMFAILESGKSTWFAVGTLFFFALAFYLSGWEHNIYVRKRASLERLRDELLHGDQAL